MSNSTEGVTLYAGFLFDLVRCFPGQGLVSTHLHAMTKGFVAERPTELAPMRLYNDMCSWIENQVGPASIRRAGFAIGDRAYDQITQDPTLPKLPKPIDILTALKRVASVMIQDPEGRGWEIPRAELDRVLMRRTQTFNCILQEGLLEGLMRRTGRAHVTVVHIACDRQNAPYCEYLVSWR